MTGFVEVKTAGLEGVALDWAVAQAAGWVAAKLVPVHAPSKTYYEVRSPAGPVLIPSSSWAQGGPLISRFLIDFSCDDPTTIGAALCDENGMYLNEHMAYGSTHLIAACRAIVAHKLGDTVSVPKEFLS